VFAVARSASGEVALEPEFESAVEPVVADPAQARTRKGVDR
jgi:hypothetical protein